MTNRAAVVHVSRALKMHGISHLEGTPSDEYDCCAEIAIEAYNNFLLFYSKKDKTKKKNEVVSDLLN